MAITKIVRQGIADDAIDGTKIADDVINSEHIVDAGVDSAHINDVAASKLTGTIASGRLSAANLGSGTVPTARLGSGTANNAVFLRGDNTWAAAGSTSASDLTSGTLADARFPSTLPAISGANLTGIVSQGRNLIINGGMDVWQRATSFALTNGKAYTADRFWLNPQSVASTHSRQAVTSPIAGMASQYCLRIQRNINVSATGLIYFATDLESTNAFACRGRKLTLSFYARKHATGYTATSDLFSLGIVSGKGTDQTLVNGYTSGSYVANQSNTLTSSWQRFTVTTSSVIADDITQIGLQGTRTSVGTAGTNDYMEITGIQVEISDAATDFEHRSYGEELALCQRYFFKTQPQSVAADTWSWGGGLTIAPNTGNRQTGGTFPVTMRASATVTVLSTDSSTGKVYRSGSHVAASIPDSGENGFRLSVSGGVSTSADAAMCFYADAEL
jgi:hypothetical protein